MKRTSMKQYQAIDEFSFPTFFRLIVILEERSTGFNFSSPANGQTFLLSFLSSNCAIPSHWDT